MKRIFVLLVAFLSLFSVSFFSLASWSEALSFPHIEVSGYGEVVVKPDMAEFKVHVEKMTLTAEDAKVEVDKVVMAFIDRLIKAGVSRDDILATNIRLAPKYTYPKSGQPELVGYQASRSITVTVIQLDRLNTYLDDALGDGINRIDSIQLKVKDQKKYQDQARLIAIKEASEKAEFLAKGFNKRLGEVWRIAYNHSHIQPIQIKAMTMDSRSESTAFGYQDSTVVIKDRVAAVYKLAD